MRHYLMFFVLVFFCGLFSSCGEKLNESIGYLKNNTNEELIVGQYNRDIVDSLVCSDKPFLEYDYIKPNITTDLSSRHINLLSEPDSSKEYFYVFNSDSLNKYRKLKLCDGIVNHCLVKRVVIQLNKVKDPLDTIVVDSNKPLN